MSIRVIVAQTLKEESVIIVLFERDLTFSITLVSGVQYRVRHSYDL